MSSNPEITSLKTVGLNIININLCYIHLNCILHYYIAINMLNSARNFEKQFLQYCANVYFFFKVHEFRDKTYLAYSNRKSAVLLKSLYCSFTFKYYLIMIKSVFFPYLRGSINFSSQQYLKTFCFSFVLL